MKKIFSIIVALLLVVPAAWAGPQITGGYSPGQSVEATASPTFVTETLSGLTASKPVFTDGSKGLTSSGTVPVNQGGTGNTTGNAATVTNLTVESTSVINQDVTTDATPQFYGYNLKQDTYHKTHKRFLSAVDAASHPARNVVALSYADDQNEGLAFITVRYAGANRAADAKYATGIWQGTWQKYLNNAATKSAGVFTAQENATLTHPVFAWSGDTLTVDGGVNYTLWIFDIEVVTLGEGALLGITYP